jgi:hypothetical protein
MAAFQVIINGRFWVITEGLVVRRRSAQTRRQEGGCSARRALPWSDFPDRALGRSSENSE